MKVSFFEVAGKSPVEEFFKNQSPELADKISRRIDLLEEFGSNLRAPYSEKVVKDLFALRVTGSVQVRVFYAFIGKGTAVLLHAFKKKTSKIPPKEIEIAQARLKLLTA